MKRALLVLAVLLAVAGLGWWLWPDDAPATQTDGGAGATFVAEQPGLTLAPIDPSLEVDAGVGRVKGRVVTDEGVPVPNARVRLYEGDADFDRLTCGVCHEGMLTCEDPSTVKQVIDALRSGRLVAPRVLAEQLTGPDGSFDFGERSLAGDLYAVAGERSGVSELGEELELVVSPATEVTVTVVDGRQAPIGGADLQVFSPREGALSSVRADADGVARLKVLDERTWVFAEREGALPAGSGRIAGGDLQLVLAPPHTLVIHTRLGTTPIDATVTIGLHGGDQKLRTAQGTLRLEQLPAGFFTIDVATDDFAAPTQMVELVEPVTELEFQLRKSAKLVVTVLTSAGDPVELVSGSLSGEGANVDATAEHGALLLLGPVPEGEYTFTASADGMVPATRRVDLHPGENNLEVLLRTAPKLEGTVKLPDGKPAAGARVSVFEEEQETTSTVTDDDGHFSMELMYPGRFLVRADAPRDGVGEVTAQVPGPPVTVTLDAKGVLEVVVIDEDGTKLPADLLVRSDAARFVRWVEDQDQLGRLAGLLAGKYIVEKTLPERMPIEATVEIVEGRTTRLTLTAKHGARLTGQVVDAAGKPVAEASVLCTARNDSVQTDEQGRFELKGVKPGEVELFAVSREGAQTDKVKLTAPATDVVLKLPEMVRVRGRVVDERGAPVPEFDANGTSIKSTDGRFDVEAPNKNLDVWREGFVPIFLSPAEGDVGDVVLKRQPTVEGEVVDGEGRPVSGATVMCSAEMAGVTTDGQGRFTLPVTSEEPQELIASRGAAAGRAPLVLGQRARVVLRRGTQIVGRVLDAAGRPMPTLVRATNVTANNGQEVDTDENGRFQLELSQGVWLFATRSNRLTRSVEVSGERMELTLGEQSGQCGAVVRSSRLIDGLWFLAGPRGEGGPWEVLTRGGGSFEYPVMTPSLEVAVRGVPCGRYTLAASIENLVTEVAVDLQGPAQAIVVEPSPVLLVPEEAPPPEAPEGRAP